MWNANVSPITLAHDTVGEEEEEDRDLCNLHPDNNALFQSFQSENITDTIDQEGGPNARLINH